jgi:hypothetical protein
MTRRSGTTLATGEDNSPFLVAIELTEGTLQVPPPALDQKQECSQAWLLVVGNRYCSRSRAPVGDGRDGFRKQKDWIRKKRLCILDIRL